VENNVKIRRPTRTAVGLQLKRQQSFAWVTQDGAGSLSLCKVRP